MDLLSFLLAFTEISPRLLHKVDRASGVGRGSQRYFCAVGPLPCGHRVVGIGDHRLTCPPSLHVFCSLRGGLLLSAGHPPLSSMPMTENENQSG